MDREQGVVGLGGDQVLEGSQLDQPHDQADARCDEEEDDHRDEIEQADALVVGGGQPGHEPRADPCIHEVAGLTGCGNVTHSPSSDLAFPRPFKTRTDMKITAASKVMAMDNLVKSRTYLRPWGS